MRSRRRRANSINAPFTPMATCRAGGLNRYGEIGDGTTNFYDQPVDVVGLTDVIAAAGGYFFTCALERTGDVACWGANDGGQLGDDTTSNASLPSRVLPPL